MRLVVGGRQARQRKLEAAERARQRAEAEAARLEEERRKAIFTEEEQVKLAQAMKKFPPGTINRWEKISRCAARARAAVRRTSSVPVVMARAWLWQVGGDAVGEGGHGRHEGAPGQGTNPAPSSAFSSALDSIADRLRNDRLRRSSTRRYSSRGR